MGKVLPFLLSALPSLLSAQYLNFPEEDIEIFHGASKTEYVREDGNGESPDTAPTFYIPIASTGSSDHETTENMTASLASGSTARSTLAIPVRISINDSGRTWDAFIAAKKSNSEQYQVVYNLAGVTDNQTVDLTPDLRDICDEDNELDINCEKFEGKQGDREEILLFMGVGVQGDVDHSGSTDSIDPKNYPEGDYIRLKMSSDTPTAAPLIEKLHKGEGRLKVTFQGSQVEDVDSLYAYIQVQGEIASDKECESKAKPLPDSYTDRPEGGEDKKLGTGSKSGTVFIKELKNRHCYSIQIYYRDKYGFASNLSGGFNAAPDKLEKLLEKNSCFLLTAGFGGGDPLIDDFRYFRDNTLKQHPLGRAFIRFYYRHAPAYAPAIAASPLLSALIRNAARMFHRMFLRKK